MKTVPIHASSEYSVKIGSGLLSGLGHDLAQMVIGRTAVIVSDSNVWPIYGEIVENSLKEKGFSVFSFVFPAGEQSKNPQTYLHLLNFLAENQLTRKDCLIALGGGVTGDLCGFAAATYLRGVDYIQLPTSLLAMVDSSVGGKTAIDLPAGKNLAGAFYQPQLVVCDTDTLDTLPTACFSDGFAEVIKYALLFDAPLFSALEEHLSAFCREDIIYRCVRWKAEVVAQDEFDNGRRQLLNLGHTLGHAIEKCSGYTLSHGQAVAIGMSVITRAAAQWGDCETDIPRRLTALLEKIGLPTNSPYPLEALLPHILSDKKRSGDQITLAIVSTIGCAHLKTMPLSQLKSFLKAGM